jgi:hypothetical protein
MVGERRALSSAVMALFFLLFLVQALLGGDDTKKFMYSMAGCYGLAFFSLVAGYFWARWYAVGLGLFGVIVAAVACWQLKTLEQTFLIFGGLHLGAALLLWGDAMSQAYDGQAAWREKFHMDDNAVQRLGRAVIRAGVSLPFVLAYAFAPRPESGSLLASIVALCLTGLGVRALIQLKTWGVMALAAAGLLMTAIAGIDIAQGNSVMSIALPALSAVFLLGAAAPFARTMARYVVRGS